MEKERAELIELIEKAIKQSNVFKVVVKYGFEKSLCDGVVKRIPSHISCAVINTDTNEFILSVEEYDEYIKPFIDGLDK